MLFRSQQFQSSVRPLGAWLKQTMGIDLAERTLWPVCYGGLFGATKKTIHRTSRTSWEQMRDSLTRGDNIEEGHYAERSWLGLLSQPLTESHERKLQGAATGTCATSSSFCFSAMMTSWSRNTRSRAVCSASTASPSRTAAG